VVEKDQQSEQRELRALQAGKVNASRVQVPIQQATPVRKMKLSGSTVGLVLATGALLLPHRRQPVVRPSDYVPATDSPPVRYVS
jgi:hypothetical protein